MTWTKTKTGGFSASEGPFAVSVEPKGDGRWSWQIIQGSARSPSASGIGSSAGAAKTAAEQYVKRSGLV